MLASNLAQHCQTLQNRVRTDNRSDGYDGRGLLSDLCIGAIPLGDVGRPLRPPTDHPAWDDGFQSDLSAHGVFGDVHRPASAICFARPLAIEWLGTLGEKHGRIFFAKGTGQCAWLLVHELCLGRIRSINYRRLCSDTIGLAVCLVV